MTFKHKLSARLARLWWGAPLLALLITASCDIQARNAVDPNQPVLDIVQVLPAAVTLGPNAMADFVAVGLTAGGDTVESAVSWSVTGGQLLETTNSGRQHRGRYQAGTQPGTYRVVVSAPSPHVGLASDTANVLVTTIPVASVVVSPASVPLDVGETAQLTATAQDSNGATLSGRVITWSSGNTAVATVSSSGLVTARAAGSATVTATSEGKSGTAAVTVTQVPVASVEVTPATANISVGGTVQLTAVAKDSAGRILSGRPMSWISSNTQIATVAAGLVAGVAAGTAFVVASTEGKSDTATITVTFVPVAAVTVSPSSTSVFVGANVQLTATTRDANGNTLTGRSISWASSNTAVATVNTTGRVTGVAAGSATITATSEGINGTSAISVQAPPPPPPPPPPGTTCLAQSGPTITVSGVLTTWGNTSMAASTKVDATAAIFSGGANTPVRIGGGSGICFFAGTIIGALPPSTTWSRMHDTYAMVVNGASSLIIENARIFDYGDGPTFDEQADVNWTIRGMYLKYMRDDCIENDFLNSGTIEDSFFDGCYDGVSSRDYAGAQDGSNNTVVVRNSLIRLQAMDQAYGGAVPNHNAFWKWSPSIGPKVALYNTVFRADSRSREGNGAGMYMAPPPGKLADCENNVMVWLGSGSFPETLPTTFNGKPCFRLLTGAEGLQYWNDAVAQWKANHPWMTVDAGPPIVSLFSPGIQGSTTLTGTVTLTATAVDDQDIAGVQLQMNGQNIGPELTESPLTKFTLSWDSRGLPNGTYTLTARARDTAGRVTTSAGVTVTISN